MCRVYGVSGRVEMSYSTQDMSAVGNFDYRTVLGDTLIMQSGQPMANITIPVRFHNSLCPIKKVGFALPDHVRF